MYSIGYFGDNSIGTAANSDTYELKFILFDSTTWTIDGVPVGFATLTPSEANSSFVEVVDELRGWGPIFARHDDFGSGYELKLRSLALDIFALGYALNQTGIRHVIFQTFASHHIDSLVCELACRLYGIHQVFLYGDPFKQRILPFIQTRNILDRRPLGVRVSNAVYDNILQSLADGRQVQTFPSNIKMREKAWSVAWRNLLFRFAVLCHRALFRGRIAKPEMSVSSELRLLNTHHKALKTLREYSEKDAWSKALDICDSQESLIPVIFAHLQPEATTFPEGGLYSTHVDVVASIRERGYLGPIIYKEHPVMYFAGGGRDSHRGGVYRSPEYYRQLLDLGCIFAERGSVMPDNDRFLPVTITGSIGVERALRGLPTIVAGHPWYSGLPGTLDLTAFENSLSYEALGSELEIKKQAQNFLKNILNFNTIENSIGVGFNIQKVNAERDLAFFTEFRNFLTELTILNETQ